MEHQKVFFDKAKLIDNFVKKARAFGCKVKEAIADTGYDSHRIFRYLAEKGIKPVIEFRKGAVITGDRVKDEVVREIRRDRERRKERNGYGRRWNIESFFSSFKQLFGEHVSSVKSWKLIVQS